MFDDAVVLIAGSLPMAHARPALPLPDPVAGGVSGCGDGEGEGEGALVIRVSDARGISERG